MAIVRRALANKFPSIVVELPHKRRIGSKSSWSSKRCRLISSPIAARTPECWNIALRRDTSTGNYNDFLRLMKNFAKWSTTRRYFYSEHTEMLSVQNELSILVLKDFIIPNWKIGEWLHWRCSEFLWSKKRYLLLHNLLIGGREVVLTAVLLEEAPLDFFLGSFKELREIRFRERNVFRSNS